MINSSHCLIQHVRRRGKQLCLELLLSKKEKTKYLFVHMGMTGRITRPDRAPSWGHESSSSSSSKPDYPPRHTHLHFFAGSVQACFSDPRKFGAVYLSDTDAELQALAPDALTEIKADDTSAALVGLARGIKAVLLDQKRVVSGVGNWVADEVLYQSGIHPDQAYLTPRQAEMLQKSLQDILREAVECLEASKDYPSHWLFHYRWAKKKNGARDARGRAIQFITSGGRTSAVVGAIQKLCKSQRPEKLLNGVTSTKKKSSKKQSTKVKQLPSAEHTAARETRPVAPSKIYEKRARPRSSAGRQPARKMQKSQSVNGAASRRRSPRLQASGP